MADVTISSLPLGTPSGNAVVPFSTGSNTLAVPVSAIFQNTKNVNVNKTTSSTYALDIASNTTAGLRLAPEAGSSGTGPSLDLDVKAAVGQYTAVRIQAENTNNTTNDGGLIKIYCAAEDAPHTLTERLKISSVGIYGKNINPLALINGTDQTFSNNSPGTFYRCALNNPLYVREGSWDNINYRYTIPTTGTYVIEFNFNVSIRNGGTNSDRVIIQCNKNGSSIGQRRSYASTGDGWCPGVFVYGGSFTAGDLIDFNASSTSYYSPTYAFTGYWTTSLVTISRV